MCNTIKLVPNCKKTNPNNYSGIFGTCLMYAHWGKTLPVVVGVDSQVVTVAGELFASDGLRVYVGGV